MTLNEADTRANLIDPRLEAAGWGRDQIKREHYYRRDVEYTPGRVFLRGTRSRRKKGRKADYLLRYAGFPIAVVEAKAEDVAADSGFGQSKSYAQDLGVPFAYATNGHVILEYDYFTRQSDELETFPTPQDLWKRWLTNTGISDVTDTRLMAEARQLYDPQAAEARRNNPLLHPYCPTSITGKEMRYYQETAIARILKRVLRGQKRVLLTMATGTGKTFTAFQVVWKLLKSRWLHRRHPGHPARVLFLADRVILRDQAYNAFSPFASEASDPRFRIEGRPIKTHFDLYFGIYQTLWGETENGQRLYQAFEPDFFDLVIIDEAHRSGFGTWREILDYFGSAIQLGMTATPKRSDNVDTYAYFCAEEERHIAIQEGRIIREPQPAIHVYDATATGEEHTEVIPSDNLGAVQLKRKSLTVIPSEAEGSRPDASTLLSMTDSECPDFLSNVAKEPALSLSKGRDASTALSMTDSASHLDSLSSNTDSSGEVTQPLAAFEYSLGQGIEDGFLATYKVHRVRTTVDKAGLHLQDALQSGAEVIVPDEVEARDVYNTPQFEREITVPDRTKAMVEHLAGLIRRFGPMEKTMVFCVDTAHAQLTARYLNDAFAHLGYVDYAVPIVAEEGEDAKQALRRFQDSDQKTPVIATTAELLSTGVDVPSCRNIVFMKTVASTVLFKQILGRGSRIDDATGKYWFRVIDYTGATQLFDEWDRPPVPPDERETGPETATLTGKVVTAENGDLLVGATVAVLLGPNTQRGPIYTGDDGGYTFEKLPAGMVTLIVSGPGYRHRQMQIELSEGVTTTVDVELKIAGEPAGKIRVSGLEVTIADEAIFMIEATGQSLSLQEYENYTRRKVQDLAGAQGFDGLLNTWVNPAHRQEFLDTLERASVRPDVLAEVKGLSDADLFDVLAHLAFGAPVHTRDERAQAFRNRQQRFLQGYSPKAQEVILALLEKYQLGGVEEIADSKVFRLPPFNEMGQVVGVTRRFGDVAGLRAAVDEMQKRLYTL